MRIEIKTAVIIALAGFLWAVLEFASGLHGERIGLHQYITWFAFIPTLLIYVWHYRNLRRVQPFTFKNGFVSGIIVTAWTIPLNIAGFLIFYYFVNPGFFSAFTKYTVENKVMSATEAEGYFNLSNYLVQISIGLLLIGLILSVVLSLIFKSKLK